MWLLNLIPFLLFCLIVINKFYLYKIFIYRFILSLANIGCVKELNNERKELTAEVYEKCLAQVEEKGWQHRNTLVLYDPDFHEGVLGLVANKVVEKLHKPTLVFTKDENGELKKSITIPSYLKELVIVTGYIGLPQKASITIKDGKVVYNLF